jgi:hypothetical protein
VDGLVISRERHDVEETTHLTSLLGQMGWTFEDFFLLLFRWNYDPVTPSRDQGSRRKDKILAS